MTNKVKLPNVDVRNIKDIVILALKNKIDSLGDLQVPIDITREYPRRESFLNRKDGTYRVSRKIVVKRNRTSVNNPSVGWDYGTLEFDPVTLVETQRQGWEEVNIIELQVWSPDSRDRDLLLEFVKDTMLESEQRELPDGGRFFYNYGVHAVRFLSITESENSALKLDGPMYVGTLTYSIISEYSGLTSTEYERYDYILGGVIAYPNDGTGTGSGSNNGSGGSTGGAEGTPGSGVVIVDTTTNPSVPYQSPSTSINHSGCIGPTCEYCSPIQ